MSSQMKVIASGRALGAEIQGVDVRSLNEKEFAAIYRDWLDHLVVLIRGQVLTDQDFIAFSGR